MVDPRVALLAETLVTHSIRVQPGEHVLIQAVSQIELALIRELVKSVQRAGGFAHISLKDQTVTRELIRNGQIEQFRLQAEIECAQLDRMDAYINLRSPENAAEFSDISPEQMQLYTRHFSAVQSEAVYRTKWVTTRFPNSSLAQSAKMSLETFENLYFSACTLDYLQLSAAMEPLQELMAHTDEVRIVGPQTDLTFSIKGIGVLKGDGRDNLPDGELYTAPIKHTVNGTVFFPLPATFHGFTYENIRLTFQNGRVVDAQANDSDRLNRLLSIDEGARFVGEFALAFNNRIWHPLNNTLFDEKIAGSFHLALGSCFAGADNGNQSAIHWDLVAIQRPEYGGGEIWFDGRLIRQDGLFVLPELKPLNP